jgi:hypothetical protein
MCVVRAPGPPPYSPRVERESRWRIGNTQIEGGREVMFKKVVLVAVALLLAAAPRASAQTTQPTEVMFHWGAIHKAPGQAVVLNFELTDHFGEPLTVPVEFHLEDREGNVIYTNTVMVPSGRTFSTVFVIGPEIRVARSTIQGDIYAVIAPDIRLLLPCVKVDYPPGPNAPVDRVFATLEVMDVLTGRVQVFANDPHIRFGLGIPQ